MRVFFYQDKGVKIMCNKVQAQGQDHKFSLGLSDGSQGQLSVQWPSGHFELLLPGLARERGLLSCWSILVLRDRAGLSYWAALQRNSGRRELLSSSLGPS